MRIGFTGTRYGMSQYQRKQLMLLLNPQEFVSDKPTEFHHGDCLGADEEAFHIASSLDIFTIAHPSTLVAWTAYTASNRRLFPLEPLERNKVIVRSVDRLIAAPRVNAEIDDNLRSGTWQTIRFARRLGIPVQILNRL